MKNYSQETRWRAAKDKELLSNVRDGDGNIKYTQVGPTDVKVVNRQEMEYIMSSQDFIENYQGYIDDIAMFKTYNDGKSKTFRSMDYAATGVMDLNDIKQEAYLAFLEGYEKLDGRRKAGGG